ncbi:MAG: hypothetical protein IJJ26_07155 [Victivallales bacterium]|nr:hypothetical protein [Victivallales bacterium]
MIIDEELRNEMRSMRIRLGWNIRTTAATLGVHPITYLKWENGTCSKCRLNNYRAILKMIRGQNQTSPDLEIVCERLRHAYLACPDDDTRELLTRRLRNTVVAALEYLGKSQ